MIGKIIDKIYDWITNKLNKIDVYKNLLEETNIQYAYLHQDKNEILHQYLNQKCLEISEIENIKIFSISYDELNKKETKKEDFAIGAFIYLEDYEEKYKQTINEWRKFENFDFNFDLKREYIYPRIEICEKANSFTIIHELGHYFLHKNRLPQTEVDAELYILEFFKLLPPFFYRYDYIRILNLLSYQKTFGF